MHATDQTKRIAGMEPIADSVPYQATGSNVTPLQTAFLRELFISQNAQGYAALCQAIANAKAPDYEAITAPMLVVVGSEDKSATPESCNLIFDQVKSSPKRLEVLPGIGHWYCVEEPDGVAKLVWGFANLLQGISE